MRRLLRILLNTATVLSLLLSVATAVAWVRSYWVLEGASDQWASLTYVLSGEGEAAIYFRRFDGGARAQWQYARFEGTGRAGRLLEMRIGGLRNGFDTSVLSVRYDWIDWVQPPPYTFELGVTFRYWVVFALASVLPLGRLAMVARSRIARCKSFGTLCVACGYDLCGTPERCPECGIVATARCRHVVLRGRSE